MRIFRFLVFFWLALGLAGPLRAETPSEIPNPLRTRRSWVADSANVLSAEDERRINAVLSPLERQNGAEVAVVTVRNLGGQSVEDFANELFRLWKIGKKGKDNGVVILAAIDDRKARIDVDYGLQDVITDGQAGEILRTRVTPAFKRGAYGDGIYAGVVAVAQKIDPSAAVPTESSSNSSANGAAAIAPRPTASTGSRPSQSTPPQSLPNQSFPSGSSDGSYDSPNNNVSGVLGLILTLFGFFVLLCPLFFIGGIIWFVVSRFKRPPSCPRCKSQMVQLSEAQEIPFLTPIQQFEQRIGARDYRVWQCPQCHTETISAHDQGNGFSACPKCHNQTARTTRRIVQQPTHHRQGREETTTFCQLPNCGYQSTNERTIPRLSSNSDFATGAGIGSVFGSSTGSTWGGSSSSSSHDSSSSSSNDSSSSSSSFDSGPSDFGGSDSGGGGGGASDSW
jgi:uncharacterized protein